MACAAVAGAGYPPLGACMRTLWPRMLGDDPSMVHAAFALESAAFEVAYIAGPVVVAGAIGSRSTTAAALVCAGLLLAGTAAFAADPISREWRPVHASARAATGRIGALRAPGVQTLMLVFFLIGATFGAVEVAVPAAAEEDGVPGAAGLILGFWGLGSLLGGIAAARAGAPADPVRRLVILLAVLAAGHLLPVLATGPELLTALLVVAGLAIAPAIACAYGLVDGLAPAGTVTEAYTWLSTGIAAGLALGAGVAGALAEHSGSGAAFAAAGAACAGAAVAGALRRRTLAPGYPGPATAVQVAPSSPERFTVPSSDAR